MANRDKWLKDNTHNNKVKFSHKKSYEYAEDSDLQLRGRRKRRTKKGRNTSIEEFDWNSPVDDYEQDEDEMDAEA